MIAVKVGDWVKAMEGDRIGLVKRVAKDGTWADVDWRGWSKRMRLEFLRVQHTIPFGDGTITDMNREEELRGTSERTTQ